MIHTYNVTFVIVMRPKTFAMSFCFCVGRIWQFLREYLQYKTMENNHSNFTKKKNPQNLSIKKFFHFCGDIKLTPPEKFRGFNNNKNDGAEHAHKIQFPDDTKQNIGKKISQLGIWPIGTATWTYENNSNDFNIHSNVSEVPNQSHSLIPSNFFLNLFIKLTKFWTTEGGRYNKNMISTGDKCVCLYVYMCCVCVYKFENNKI